MSGETMKSASKKNSILSVSRLLIGLYSLFAVAAGVRSSYQLLTKFELAPLAYSLSTIAAFVYLIAILALRRRSRLAWWVTMGVCIFELIGVVTVGLLTLFEPQLFADETVWSLFGQGYGYLPLILPLMGMWWLTRSPVMQEYQPTTEV